MKTKIFSPKIKLYLATSYSQTWGKVAGSFPPTKTLEVKLYPLSWEIVGAGPPDLIFKKMSGCHLMFWEFSQLLLIGVLCSMLGLGTEISVLAQILTTSLGRKTSACHFHIHSPWVDECGGPATIKGSMVSS